MKKKIFRERYGYTIPTAYEKDPITKTVTIKAVKTKKVEKKKSDK